MQAAELWASRGLLSEPYAMNVSNAAGAQHTLPMSKRDMHLAEQLLNDKSLPHTRGELLRWCIENERKAEQENWIANGCTSCSS
jgi:hypothetical protein